MVTDLEALTLLNETSGDWFSGIEDREGIASFVLPCLCGGDL